MANQTRFDWLEDAAIALEAAVKQPKFPGDGSFALPLLEKLVDKLFGECHNGGEVGLDECAACRAWRTERVEGELSKQRAVSEEFATKLAVSEENGYLLRTQLEEMTGICKKQEDEAKFSAQALKKAREEAETAKTESAALNAERQSVQNLLDRVNQAHNEALSDNAALTERVEKFVAVIDTLKDI